MPDHQDPVMVEEVEDTIPQPPISPPSILKKPAPLPPPPLPEVVGEEEAPSPAKVVDEVVSFSDHDDFFWSVYRRAAEENKRSDAFAGLVNSLITDEEAFHRKVIEAEGLRWYVDGEGYKTHSGMFLRKLEILRKKRQAVDMEEELQAKRDDLDLKDRTLDDRKAELDDLMAKLIGEHNESVAWLHRIDVSRREDESRLIKATGDAVDGLDGVQQFFQTWQGMSFEREEEAYRASIEHEALSTRLAVRSAYQTGLLALERMYYRLQYQSFMEEARKSMDAKNLEFEATRADILKSEQEKLAQLDGEIDKLKTDNDNRQQLVMDALGTAATHEATFMESATTLFSEWKSQLKTASEHVQDDRVERIDAAREDQRRRYQLEDKISDALDTIASLRDELEVLRKQREEDAAAREAALAAAPVVSPPPVHVDQSIQSDNTTARQSTPPLPEPFTVFQLQGQPLPEGWTSLAPTFYMRGAKCVGEAVLQTNIADVSVVVNAEEFGEFEDAISAETFANQRVNRMMSTNPAANIAIKDQGPAIYVLEQTDFEWRLTFTSGVGTSESRTNMMICAVFENVGYCATLSSPTAHFEEVVSVFATFMMSVRIIPNPRRASWGHGRPTTVRYASHTNHKSTVDIPLCWRPLSHHNESPMYFSVGLEASPQENVALRLDAETGKVRLSSWKELPMDVARRVISSARVRDYDAVGPRMFIHHSLQFPLPDNNDCLIYEHTLGDYEVTLRVALTPSTAVTTKGAHVFCNNLTHVAPRAIIRVAIVDSPEGEFAQGLTNSITRKNPELMKYLEKRNQADKAFVEAGFTKRQENTTIVYAVERAPQRWILFHAEIPLQQHIKVIAQYLSKVTFQCELFTPLTTNEAALISESPSRFSPSRPRLQQQDRTSDAVSI